MISEAKKKRANDKMQQLAKEIILQATARDRAQKKISKLECRIRELSQSVCEHCIRDNSESYVHPHNGDLVEHEEYKCEKCGKLFDKEEYTEYSIRQLKE
jgi:transposase-like protein